MNLNYGSSSSHILGVLIHILGVLIWTSSPGLATALLHLRGLSGDCCTVADPITVIKTHPSCAFGGEGTACFAVTLPVLSLQNNPTSAAEGAVNPRLSTAGPACAELTPTAPQSSV